jgi:hypothetical protein
LTKFQYYGESSVSILTLRKALRVQGGEVPRERGEAPREQDGELRHAPRLDVDGPSLGDGQQLDDLPLGGDDVPFELPYCGGERSGFAPLLRLVPYALPSLRRHLPAGTGNLTPPTSEFDLL